jgi:hypothetical protein
MKYLGEEPRFWAAVALALLVKFLLSPAAHPRKAIGGAIAGALCAFFGTDPVVSWFDQITAEDRDIVVIVLVLTGEHLMRWLIRLTPESVLQAVREKRK